MPRATPSLAQAPPRLAPGAPAPAWHQSNPWAQKIIYLPLLTLSAQDTTGALQAAAEQWAKEGVAVDAYLLPPPAWMADKPSAGRWTAGVRYGPQGHDYLSLHFPPEALAALAASLESLEALETLTPRPALSPRRPGL